MFNRSGLDRFKKAQSLEPFSVNTNPVSKPPLQQQQQQSILRTNQPQEVQPQKIHGMPRPPAPEPTPTAAPQSTGIGGGQSNWQPPEWAVEPRPGVYQLDVVKDGEVLDHINLDKRRHIFGRQVVVCDFVLDHPSISRQHAAVVQHRNGSVYVIDLGSVHGTFVANERLTKNNPVELEVGQSLRFAASSRSYILRKNTAALLPSQKPAEVALPPPPDPSDEEAVVAYNTLLNRLGATRMDVSQNSTKEGGVTITVNKDSEPLVERPSKRQRRARVAFRDQHGGELVEVVGISDGADVSTEPGPIGVKEGSLVGKYESLVQVTVIPKGQDKVISKEESDTPKGVTQKLQQYLNKVKSPAKGGFYDDLYGDSFAGQVGASWANTSKGNLTNSDQGLANGMPRSNSKDSESSKEASKFQNSKSDSLFDDDDDLFGDSMEDDKDDSSR